jgi:acetolactate synthase-1/2/3 large subunit
MGYDLPAAIGVCVASGKKEVILMTGDGSIMMNIQELQTIRQYNFPIKIFLLNNQGYLAIRNTQDNYFKSHYVGSDARSGVTMPNFKKVAQAFGIEYEVIKNHKAMAGKIKKVLRSKGPILCEMMMDPKQQLLPRLKSEKMADGTLKAKPLEDMYPYLEINKI